MPPTVLFLCGSPRRARSASRATARYLARFLDHDFVFVDAAAPGTTPADLRARVVAADAVVWTFGAWTHFVPDALQAVFEDLFEQGRPLQGKLTAAVMTSVRVHDDEILERVRLVSEQLGGAYLGDVSAYGSPYFGYVGDEAVTEASCRVLAQRLDRALTDGHRPARAHALVDLPFLTPSGRGAAFPVDGPPAPKDLPGTLLVLTGHRLAQDPAHASVVEAVRTSSRRAVEVVEVEALTVGRCVGCLQCLLGPDGVCAVPDDFQSLRRRLHGAAGVVLLGCCSGGFVDRPLKSALDRTLALAHRPSLQGRYGFAVATGGGPLEPEVARVLSGLLGTRGVCSLGALAPSADPGGFPATLRRTVEDLDRAIEERWEAAPRFGVQATRDLFRHLALESGHVLRADYRYYRADEAAALSLPGTGRALLRLAFRSRGLGLQLLATQQRRLERQREQRLAALLAAGGRLGRGRDLGAPPG